MIIHQSSEEGSSLEEEMRINKIKLSNSMPQPFRHVGLTL
jgi:hypothetical protein